MSPIVHVLAAIAALHVWVGAAAAHAQARTIELAVDERSASQLDAAALASALAQELGRDVVVVDTRAVTGDALRLSASVSRAGRVTLTLARGEGRRLRRFTRLPAEPSERTATLVILAANMLRDEASELLEMLRRRRAPPELPDEDTTSPPPAAADAAALPPPADALVAPESPAAIGEQRTEEALAVGDDADQVAALEPSGDATLATSVEDTTTSDADPSSVPDEPTDPPIDPSPDEPPRDPFLRLGLGAQLGSVPGPGSGVELAWFAGLEVALTPLPFLALGVREFGGGLSRTNRFHVGAVPFIELAWRFAEWGDLHGSVGAHVQYIGGEGLAGGVAGVAPLAMIGARLFLASFFSIGVETEFRGVATDTFHTGIELLPAGSVMWTGGLSFAFHIN